MGEEYEYIRDHRGNVVEEKGYDGVWKKYRRTLGGKVRGTKRSNESAWTKINYDKTGLMSSILYPDGKEEKFKFGVMGELLEAENEVSKVTLTYDESGNVISENQNGYEVTSEYSKKYAVSQREVLKSSLGLDINLTHNEIGAVEEVVASFGNVGNWQNKFEYNKVGQLTSRTLSEDLTETRNYDILGRITNQSVTQKFTKQTDKNYTWDVNNKIKSILDNVTNIGLEYSYDKYGNLETERIKGLNLSPIQSVTQRSFDKSGNLYEMRNKGDREYKKGGQLIKTNRATYVYNDAGDLLEKKTNKGELWKYEYNANGLLSKVTRPDKNEVTFQYDALKRRISKTYKGKTTRYLWDGNKVLHEWKEYESEEPQELDVLKTPQNIVTWLYKEGTFVPIGKLTENDSYSIVSDHLGTPTEMYNSKGTLVWKIVKDIFGRVRHKIGGGTKETDCQIRSQGQYEDYETEMYYNRFRYYMPDEGMYNQRDPIGLAGGNPTLYGFVWDSTNEVDIFGLSCPGQEFSRNTNVAREIFLESASSHDNALKILLREIDDAGVFKNGSIPNVGRLQSSYGYQKIIGRMTFDNKFRWRLDFDENIGVHFNIEDFRNGKGVNSIKKVIPIEITEEEYKHIIDLWNR